MANLSAPTVSEPIYDCAERVVVSGYVPGATIDIYADAVRIGGGVSFSGSGQVFGVPPANMVAGTKIKATQTSDGDTSPSSPEVTVQTPLSVDPPVLDAPLLECARCVRVAMADGENASVAAGGPFPLIVYAHGRRKPSCLGAWQACPGAPTDTTDDYRELSGIMAHLARWGFVTIAPDLRDPGS